MSAAAWIRRVRDRPIAEHERRRALSAVIIVLAAAALALVITGPATHANNAQSGTRVTPRIDAKAAAGAQQRLNAERRRVAREFLAGYLSYLYGRGGASRISDASGSLIASLQAHPPRVPPALRTRHPRVLSVQPTSTPAGEVSVIATVNDGGLVDYQIQLRLALDSGRPLVSEVGGA